MDEMKKISDGALDQVIGGAKMRVFNTSVDYANVRCGPGKEYLIAYRVHNGDIVYTTGKTKTADGFTWAELEDGFWIVKSLLRK